MMTKHILFSSLLSLLFSLLFLLFESEKGFLRINFSLVEKLALESSIPSGDYLSQHSNSESLLPFQQLHAKQFRVIGTSEEEKEVESMCLRLLEQFGEL